MSGPDPRPEDEPPPPDVVCRAVVTSADGRRFVTVDDAGRRALPSVVLPLGNWYDVDGLLACLAADYGLRAVVLECVAGSSNVRPATERVYACATVDGSAGRGSWSDIDETGALLEPVERDWVDAALHVAAGGGRQPWSVSDWFSDVRAFLERALNATDVRLQQLRTWQRSCVLRVLTPDQRLIFKASPALFSHEPGLSEYLARRFPDRFPEVVAVDAARGWSLMEEVGGTPLARTDELGPWRQAMASFAHVQLACVEATEELLDLGCPDLRIDALRAESSELLADRAAMLPGHPDGLSEFEIAALEAAAPRVHALWEALASYGVPATLEHGDFRPEHVLVSASGHKFFDLSNGAVSHPFFSPITMLDFEDLPLGGGAAVEEDLRAAYLVPWSASHGHLDLEGAFRAARPLAILHAAVVRYQFIPHLEPREEWAFMVPYWLRKFLRALHQRPEPTEGGPR